MSIERDLVNQSEQGNKYSAINFKATQRPLHIFFLISYLLFIHIFSFLIFCLIYTKGYQLLLLVALQYFQALACCLDSCRRLRVKEDRTDR